MDLVPLASVDATTLGWLRHGDRPLEFDLRSGDQPVASLVWRAGAGSLADGRIAGGAWTLKRTGFLHPQVTVRASGSSADAARLSVHWTYHRIELKGGVAYRFHRAGVLVPAWQVTDDSGVEMLHIEPVREGRRLAGGAILASARVTGRAEFPLLLLLSWYFVILAWFEDEALIPLEGPDATAPTPP
ncbi:MAG: hypothetical protein ACRECT_03200 [Thermoplasmata archaeon]